MNRIATRLTAAAILASTLAMAGCGTVTQRGQNTAVGAGVGAVAGAVLTGGSTFGTVGGAAIGGLVGNQVNRR